MPSSNVSAPETAYAFRDQYRRDHIPASYRGGRHLLFTFGAGSTALAWCLLQLDAVQPLEWLAIPLTALYATYPLGDWLFGTLHKPGR